jgi:hypothetical protein
VAAEIEAARIELMMKTLERNYLLFGCFHCLPCASDHPMRLMDRPSLTVWVPY